ncbi:MAG TPA: hypothetical protein VLA83_09255 [Candidatus Binatia bacterium]|nr:hypothetical protein [Candidatus Binatia bacterium]
MRDDNLTIDELPAAPNGDAMWRLTGPLVITSFFEFQERVRADKSKTLALDPPFLISTPPGSARW